VKPAHPHLLKTSLGAAEAMAKMGVEFVPMPILDAVDHCTLADQMLERLKDLTGQEEARAAGDQQLEGYRGRLNALAYTCPEINNALRLAQQGHLTYQAALEMLAVNLVERSQVLKTQVLELQAQKVRLTVNEGWKPATDSASKLRIEEEQLRRCLMPEFGPGELTGPDARDVVGVFIEGETLIAMHYRVAGDAMSAGRKPLKVEVMATLAHTHTLDPWVEARRIAGMMTCMNDPFAVVDGSNLGTCFAEVLRIEGVKVRQVDWRSAPRHKENRKRFQSLRAMGLVSAAEAVRGGRLAAHNDEQDRRAILGEGMRLPYTMTFDSEGRYNAQRTPCSKPSPLFDTLCMAFLELQP
jgi:hypothetical protein